MAPQVGEIETSILTAILAGRIRPGTRLGESQLAAIYGVSRTKVREALVRLETRGVVTVSARRGWYVVEPSVEEAREAFHARRVIETGLLYSLATASADVITSLRDHIVLEEKAIADGDVGSQACLLGDFHIHLAELLGNRVLTEVIRDLTARTTLVSMLYQPREKASESNHDHTEIVDAMARGDFTEAARLMSRHIDDVEAGLDLSARPDPLELLKENLATGLLAPAPVPHRHGDTDCQPPKDHT